LLTSQKTASRIAISFLRLTLERGETSVENELEITKLTLIENNGGQGLSFINELLTTRGIASDEVLEDTT